jgi:hypothetical protein
MIWEPIEKRYNPYSIRERQMFNSSAFAIAAGVVAVGSAAAGAAVSISSADRAAKAQGSAAKKARKQEQEAFKRQQEATAQLEAELAGIQAPQWNIGADIGDAERITGYNKAQLEKLYPGATSQRELASRAITDYMRGVVPQDVQEQTMRAVAERGGAGFNLATAGAGAIPGVATSPQFDFARNLGLTSLQLQQYGMSASQDWQRLAGAFIESPLQVGQARLGFEKAASDVEMAKAEARYGARSGLANWQSQMAQGQYGRQMESIGSRLAAQQAIGTGIQSIGSATSGALMGVGSAYSQLGAAQVGGTTYGSLAAAQQAAPYAASYSQIGQNNFVPKAQAVYS